MQWTELIFNVTAWNNDALNACEAFIAESLDCREVTSKEGKSGINPTLHMQ